MANLSSTTHSMSTATETKQYCMLDGNEAAANIAHRTNEVCIIYPITPSSTMGELADQWSAEKKTNIFGTTPQVIEMQSEAGASGAIHGAVQTGALTTTFTASQGLLLMIPNMFRIAAELTPTVFHVACRSVACQGMSIYCEHSDVMATRQTGFAMLSSANVQEAHDMALIAQAASLESKVPFLHFFDGFRTSHEVSKIEYITDDHIKQLINLDTVMDVRARRMTPNNPSARGLIYNADTYFQMREAVNPYYQKLPEITEKVMQKFAKITGRHYGLMEYIGDKKAEKIIILMGSGAETASETVDYLNKHKKAKVGVIKVHLFRPFPAEKLLDLLPSSCKAIAVLDRTKEPGAAGEPLYEEVATVLLEAFGSDKLPCKKMPKIIAGRYGIASKEFTPAMVKAIFDELDKKSPKNHFTIGIDDNVTHTNLTYDETFDIEPAEVIRAVFYGLGADGTVSANKNTIKIIGEETDQHVQAYFVYDSKKSGSKTVSHLRFGPNPIRSSYLIKAASFVGCHQFNFIEKMPVLEQAGDGAIFLLNSIYGPDEIWQHLPRSLQQTIIDKHIKFYVIDAYKVAAESSMGSRINTIMQTCFFALSNVLPKEEAIKKIKDAIRKTYSIKGEEVVKQNFTAVDNALANLHEVKIPKSASGNLELIPTLPKTNVPDFVREITGPMIDGNGDKLPVGKFPADGTYPTFTTRWEKRNIALQVPKWIPEACIQCGQCSMVCPHSIIRTKRYADNLLEKAPETFQSAPLRGRGYPNERFTLQVYAEDCTGCGLCYEACPVNRDTARKRAINMEPKPQDLKPSQDNVAFFENLPEHDPAQTNATTVRGAQFLPPMFEFCGACTGCGEAQYVRILSQLFGDRLLIANACGCSSVYGGQSPTTPWTVDKNGRGPTWSSSLFEDNAEFGYGFRLAADKHVEFAYELLQQLKNELGAELVGGICNSKQDTPQEIKAQRERIVALKNKLSKLNSEKARQLASLTDVLVKQSIWAVGGDGWAYDIGYGGLDHVLASGRNINLLVLDTEVYSNTGGQASKATPRAAVVKFAAQGKPTAKKDLGLMMMTYGNIYIASISLGADPTQALTAYREAESYDGPSLIIAYSHCIAHGIDMQKGMQQQKLAVQCGYWPLYRYNPDRRKQGLNPFQLDCARPSIPFQDYAHNENRYQILMRHNPGHAKDLFKAAEEDIARRWQQYDALLGMGE